MILLLCLLLLSACDSSTKLSQPTEVLITPSPTISPTTILSTENQLAGSEDDNPSKIIMEKYPELLNFTSSQDWKSITVISGQDSVNITDPELLQAVGRIFIIRQENNLILNGPDFDMDPFSLKITNSKGSFLVNVVQQGVATFPEFAPGVYFDVSFSDLSSFGEAFMKKPSYIPLESTESRMLNSGMIYVIEDKNHYYMFKERVRLIFIVFYLAEKRKISKPVLIPTKAVEDITFYLYGNRIEMKVYTDKIEIIDGKISTWYEVDKDVSQQIHSKISGN